jgi:hypothetical protein
MYIDTQGIYILGKLAKEHGGEIVHLGFGDFATSVDLPMPDGPPQTLSASRIDGTTLGNKLQAAGFVGRPHRLDPLQGSDCWVYAELFKKHGAQEVSQESLGESVRDTARRLVVEGWTETGWTDDATVGEPTENPNAPKEPATPQGERADVETEALRRLFAPESGGSWPEIAHRNRVSLEQHLMKQYRDRQMNPNDIVDSMGDLLDYILGPLARAYDPLAKGRIAEEWADDFLRRYSGDDSERAAPGELPDEDVEETWKGGGSADL